MPEFPENWCQKIRNPQRAPVLTKGLSSVSFWESTFELPIEKTVAVAQLAKKLGLLSSTSHDFEGALGEDYDVFFSDWDGAFNLLGQFVTIEATWNEGLPKGGGLNIAQVVLNYGPVTMPTIANSVVSHVALGDNALPANIEHAVDGNLNSDTTQGNTIGQLAQRLRITVGFPCPCTTLPSPAAADMVGWWPLDELPGSFEVRDVAGLQNDGTPMSGSSLAVIGPGLATGPVSIPGQYVGNSLQFETSRYVEVPNAPELNFGSGDFTIDAWVKGFPTPQTEPIVSKRDAAGGYALYFLSSGLGLQIGGTICTGPVVPANRWSFVAVTRQSGVVRLYVDNLPPTTCFGATGSASSTGSLLIGRNTLDPHANLAIDELEIFRRALTQAEIGRIVAVGMAGKCIARRQLPVRIGVSASAGTEAVGVPIRFDQSGPVRAGTVPAPYTLELQQNASLTLEAPRRVTVNGKAFRFLRFDLPAGRTVDERVTLAATQAGDVTAVYEEIPGFSLVLDAVHAGTGEMLTMPLFVTRPSLGQQTTALAIPLQPGEPVTIRAVSPPGCEFLYWLTETGHQLFAATLNGTFGSMRHLTAVYRRTQ